MRILKLLLASLLYLVFLYLIFTIKYEHDFSSKSISVHYMNKNIYQDASKEFFSQQTLDFLNNSDSLEDINISLLEELIMDNNYVRKAEVYLDTEDTVNIYIEFREPFVRTLVDNKIYYFDSEQIMLPNLKSFDNELIVLSGDLSSVDLGSLFNLVEDIYNNHILSELIGGIHYNEEGHYVLSSRLCDLGIIIGRDPIFNFNKLKQIEVFLGHMFEQVGCDYCDLINLEYNNQIICIN